MSSITSIALVDDHVLMRNGLASLINSFEDYKVAFGANHGQDFISQLNSHHAPDIVLLDISMPVMNGYETAEWIRNNLPETKVLVLSMMDTETAIIQMLKCGARGYILKESDPKDFTAALNSLRDHGVYFNELVSNKVFHNIQNNKEGKENNRLSFTDREMVFLKLACSEKTYKEIAAEMGVSPRTVDDYRDALFEKIGVSSRIGLVLYAIKTGIVKV